MLSPDTTIVGLATNVLEMRFKVKISILLLTLVLDSRETYSCSCKFEFRLCNSYTMGCPPVRGDNLRALASGLSDVQVDNPWYNYFIPPTLV